MLVLCSDAEEVGKRWPAVASLTSDAVAAIAGHDGRFGGGRVWPHLFNSVCISILCLLIYIYIYVWSSMAISHIVLNDADSLEGKIAYLEMRQKGKRDKRGQASCTRLSVYIDTHISARVYVFAYLHAFVFLLQ